MSAPQAPPPGGWFDGEDRPTGPDLATCIHCGLCLTACPTYRTLKTEPDSPRGRLYLMRGLAEGRIAPSDPLVQHLDRCLDCRACESVCPAGVPYGHLLEQTRGQLERRWRRATPVRLLGRAVLRAILPHRGRVQRVADVLRLSQREPLAGWARSLARRGWLPRVMAQGLEMTPEIAPRPRRGLAAAVLPPGARLEIRREGLVFHPPGEARAGVAFHESCVMPALFPALDHAALRLLLRAGLEVRVPAAATCCGALHAHAGMRDDARELARRNARAFTDDCLYIVSDSAGCGAALRDGPHLDPDDPAVRRLAERSRDISEVLAHFDLPRPTRTLHAPGVPGRALRVTYHDACHLAHAQRVREAPRRLLRALPGVELVELPESDWCCGSAGVYNLQQPELAEAQLGPKLDRVASTEAHVVVASNPGCLLHMARGARARGLSVRHQHLVEVLDEAYGGEGR